MIVVPGLLRTKTIQGRYGDFTVGTLLTDIGEFSVKDKILEQYPEGEFQGQFGIIKIHANAFPMSGGIKVEVKATLHSIDIDSADEKEMPVELEPDPIELESNVHDSVSKKSSISNNKENTLDTSILGDIELTDHVRLDHTIERSILRQQITVMDQLGYKFDTTEQVWNK